MNFKEIFLGLAVLILTFFVLIYGINLFYSEPHYDDFCGPSVWNVSDLNEASCFENGGKWNSYSPPVKGEFSGYCDQDFSCREAYSLKLESYQMNVFLIAVPIGILLILLGAYFFSLDAVGVGIMGGGLGGILKGVSGYWAYSNDLIRFLISFFGLVILIYFGYRFQDRIKGKKRKIESSKKKRK